MKIKDRLVISQDKQIILIEMKNRILVVGITQQKMETLAEFEKSGDSDDFENFSVADDIEINNTGDNKLNEFNKNNGFFNLLNEKIKTGFDKLNDKNEKDKK